MLKPCAKHSVAPCSQIRHDLIPIQRLLMFVGGQHHHQIGLLHRVRHFGDPESGVFRLAPGIGSFAQTDGHVLHTGVTQVVGMCVAL